MQFWRALSLSCIWETLCCQHSSKQGEGGEAKQNWSNEYAAYKNTLNLENILYFLIKENFSQYVSYLAMYIRIFMKIISLWLQGSLIESICNACFDS